MGINGIGADYSAWRETGKVQKNGSGVGFASRMADMVGTNASESDWKTNVVSGRNNYVGGNTANIYGMGVYSRKDILVSQESETKTEIIVKPDGSRVLVMTMSIGGMETTMSLEISKPTEAPNENSKQGTDNNMPASENNTVPDEMSDNFNKD